jgi:(p)ppGpp synthase/HD superfamily hydrolase
MASTAARSAAGEREPEPLGERFADALAYATRVHRGQTRRGKPYVAHLLRVTGMVLDDGGSEDEAIAALLHDAAEDHGGRRRLQDIRRRYGDAVAAIVDSCTDTYEHPAPPWRTRKQRYLEHLPSASPSALLVSLADKVDNVRGILEAAGRRTGGHGARGRLLVLREPGAPVRAAAAGSARGRARPDGRRAGPHDVARVT